MLCQHRTFVVTLKNVASSTNCCWCGILGPMTGQHPHKRISHRLLNLLRIINIFMRGSLTPLFFPFKESPSGDYEHIILPTYLAPTIAITPDYLYNKKVDVLSNPLYYIERDIFI